MAGVEHDPFQDAVVAYRRARAAGRLAEADRLARQIVDALRPAALGAAHRTRIGDRAAEEAADDAISAYFQHRVEGKGPPDAQAGARGYVTKTVRGQVIDRKRHQQVVERTRRDVVPHDRFEDPPDVASRGEQASLVESCLRDLAAAHPAWAEAVRLVHVLCLEQADAASRMGIPVTTLNNYAYRGRRWLAGRLRACGMEP